MSKPSAMTPKRWFQLAISLLLSGVFIWWALRGVDYAKLGDALQNANYVYLAPAVFFWAAIQIVRIWRFRYLISNLVDMKFQALFRIGNISMMAILLLPVRLGEFVRPYLLKKEYGFGLSSGLGPVAAERVIDGLVVTIGFFMVTQLGLAIPPRIEAAGFAALLLFVGAATVLGLVLIGHERGAAILHKMVSIVSPRLADRVVSMVNGFAIGLRGLSKPRAAALYMFWTLAFWGMASVSNWVLLFAFDIQQPMSTGYVLTAATVIAVMIPSGPGFIGPYQLFIVESLSALGVDPTKAFAYSILSHVSSTIISLSFGMFSLLRSHLSMGAIVAASQSDRE